MRNIGLSAGIVAMVIALGGPALAQSSPTKWLPFVDFEAKPGTKRSLGEADIFQPLWQNGDTLLFANVRGRFDDHDSREGNAGLGLRHMLASDWNVGVYGYYDRRRTQYDNYFNQATFGGELLGRDWDFRGNVYLPFGERVKEVDSLNTAEISGASVVFRGGEERALRGFDGEIGWRVPIFDVESDKVLRLYAGGFRFDDDVVKAAAGPRLRAEFTMLQLPGLWDGARLILGAEYQHDDVRGSQGFAMARLRVPLSLDKPAKKLTAQESRMVERVVRDVDVVSQAGNYGPAETATQLANGTTFSVVNSSSTSGAGLNAALTAAGGNATVILAGTFNTATQTQLLGGQSLMAGSFTVRNSSGRTANLTTSATIAGTNIPAGAAVVQATDNATVSGLTITGTGNNSNAVIGLSANNTAGNIKYLNNTIIVSQTGANGALGIALGANTNVLVSGNNVTVTGAPGQNARALIISAVSTATVTGNTLSASGGGINNAAFVAAGSTIQVGSTGNTIVSGTCVNSGTGSIGFTDGTTCP